MLDTNVVSELMRPHPEARVAQWLGGLPASSLWLTVVTVAELLEGAARLPEGRRRAEVHEAVEEVLSGFGSRVLDLDVRTAPYFAQVMTERRGAGRPIDVMDAWLAAACRRHDLPLATRNVKGFEGTGLALVNPWAEVGPTPGAR